MAEGKKLKFKRNLSSPKNILKNTLDEEKHVCNLIANNIEPRLVSDVELITYHGLCKKSDY